MKQCRIENVKKDYIKIVSVKKYHKKDGIMDLSFYYNYYLL